MKVTPGLLVLALYASTSAAILGFGKTAYNKWHESELERWLSDHGIPCPKPADRKDLEMLVKENWGRFVSSPYNDWDTEELQAYLRQKGVEVDEQSKENKNWLVETVKHNWYEAESAAGDAYENVKSWIFDTWTDSQLKVFLDRHGIPNPSPRKRDTMLQAARDNYNLIAEKVGETAAYPGNWLYESWSESDLKKWLDERGIPGPQPTTRDKLIAQVRRNSHLESLKLKGAQTSASKSAEAAKQSVSDAIFNSWSDSELKNWCDVNGIRVPQGSTRNELLALARRNKAYLNDETLLESINAYYKSATNTIAATYSKATDTVIDQVSKVSQAAFDKAIETWSDSRLKDYLDSRGVPVPQNGRRDEFISKVRMYQHKAANSCGAWTFEFWTYDDLKELVEKYGDKASSPTPASRQELVDRAKKFYDQAKSSGGSPYESVTSAMAKITDSAKQQTFDAWSDSDLKAYLDSYGINTYQGSPRNELIADARRAQHMFQYGTSSPTGGIYQRMKGGMGWLYSRFMTTLGYADKQVEKVADSARESTQYVYDRGAESSEESKHRAEEKARYGYDRVYEEGQKGYHRAKEEL